MQVKPHRAGVETLFKLIECGSKYVRLHSKAEPRCLVASNADGSIISASQARDDEKSQFHIKLVVRHKKRKATNFNSKV